LVLHMAVDELKSRVVQSVDATEVVELVKSLIRIPSLQDEETKVACFIAQFMETNGIEVEMHEVEPGRFQPVGWIRGTGEGPSLAFCGHMDTQPPPMDYADEPFVPYEKNGCLYGLGVGNMKAGLGASLAAAVALRRARAALKGNLVLMPVVGEHQGGVGTDFNIRNALIPDMTIVNESTNLGILTKSPSSISVLISTFGETRHISRLFLPPEPVNAINKMCKVIDAVQRMKFTHEPSRDFPELPVVNIGAIMGGKGREYNIHRDTTTASYCTISINIRGPHSMTAESVKNDLERELERLRKNDQALQYEIEMPPETYREPWRVKKLFMPGNNLPLNSTIVEALQKNHKLVTGSEPQVGTKKYSTDDAGRLTLAGSQALSYGPGTKSESRPTREGVVIDTIVTCAKVLAATAAEICGMN